MSGMEAIVRPFQSPNVTPSTPFFTPGKAGVPNVILQCGRNGGGRMFSGSFSLSITYYMSQYQNEKTTNQVGNPAQP